MEFQVHLILALGKYQNRFFRKKYDFVREKQKSRGELTVHSGLNFGLN